MVCSQEPSPTLLLSRQTITDVRILMHPYLTCLGSTTCIGDLALLRPGPLHHKCRKVFTARFARTLSKVQSHTHPCSGSSLRAHDFVAPSVPCCCWRFVDQHQLMHSQKGCQWGGRLWTGNQNCGVDTMLRRSGLTHLPQSEKLCNIRLPAKDLKFVLSVCQPAMIAPASSDLICDAVILL